MLRSFVQTTRRSGQWSQRRYLAAGHEEAVNFWEAPLSLSLWKREQVVFAILAGWAVVIYGTRKYLNRGKQTEKPAEAKV